MACVSQNITNIAAECGTSKGGVRHIWLAVYNETKPFTVSKDSTLGINKDVTSTPDVEWFEYSFRKNTANFQSTLNVDQTNGVKYVTTVVNMSFTKMETQKRLAIASLALAEVYAVIEDNNGNFWALGLDGEGLSMTTGTAETGSSKTDTNGYTIALSVDEDNYPLALSTEAVEEFKGRVSA